MILVLLVVHIVVLFKIGKKYRKIPIIPYLLFWEFGGLCDIAY